MGMKILVTNDDGIYSEGIKILVEKAQKYGKVYVVAPKTEQSAKSHSIDIKDELESKKIDLFPNTECYYLDSTPADCVRYAYYYLHIDFDLMMSGVNKGYNLGDDILYSGTVAAVFEAGLINKRALAFSCVRDSFIGANKYIDDIMEYINENRLFDYGNIYNINIPTDAKDIKITRQGGCNTDTYFSKHNTNFYKQEGTQLFNSNPEEIYMDTACVMNNYISITPLTTDRTNIDIYKKLMMNK